jgi:hypothetical protein
MPGAVIGRNICQKVRIRVAPMPRAASSTRSSRLRMADAIGNTANGIRKCVMPSTTPKLVAHHASAAPRLCPNCVSQVLISPRFESSDTQPKARVSTEIQNGIRMQSSAIKRFVSANRAPRPERSHVGHGDGEHGHEEADPEGAYEHGNDQRIRNRPTVVAEADGSGMRQTPTDHAENGTI